MAIQNYIHVRPCTAAWLTLLFLSTATYILGYDKTGAAFITSLLIITVIKGQLIIRYFMGLRHVRPLWRNMMNAYLIAIGAIIGLAYFSH